MTTATALETKISRQKVIQHESLLEEMYTYYSLSELQAMLESEPDQVLLQKWRTTGKTLRKDIELAIEFVKND